MKASHRTLRILAAITWLIGGFVLLAKGGQLAVLLRSIDANWAGTTIGVGIIVGVLKAKYLFSWFCRRNLDRIAALKAPQIWQFFRPQFFFALVLMITFGAAMSKLAMNSFGVLVFTVALDISLALALLGSFRVFFARPAPDE